MQPPTCSLNSSNVGFRGEFTSMRSIQRLRLRAVAAGAALILSSLLVAQPPAGQPGAGAPPRGRAMPPAPKAGVCPLPILPALPAYGDQTFFTKADVPHGKI